LNRFSLMTNCTQNEIAGTVIALFHRICGCYGRLVPKGRYFYNPQRKLGAGNLPNILFAPTGRDIDPLCCAPSGLVCPVGVAVPPAYAGSYRNFVPSGHYFEL
jgi:hypothetical protein